MLLEQLIAHTEKSKLMDDVELRDEIYTVFTAVISSDYQAWLFDWSNIVMRSFVPGSRYHSHYKLVRVHDAGNAPNDSGTVKPRAASLIQRLSPLLLTLMRSEMRTSLNNTCFTRFWIFFCTLQEKVREELSEVLGGGNVTPENLPGLKYLDMVIKETLRLFPIAPLMVRELKGELDLGE